MKLKFRSESEVKVSRLKARVRVDDLESMLHSMAALARTWYPNADHDNTAIHTTLIRETIKRLNAEAEMTARTRG